jgi:hypothetical protein
MIDWSTYSTDDLLKILIDRCPNISGYGVQTNRNTMIHILDNLVDNSCNRVHNTHTNTQEKTNGTEHV